MRIAVSSGATSADNDTVKHCTLNGNVTDGNASSITSGTSSTAVSFGVFAGGGGGTTPTLPPAALPAGTAAGTSAPAGTTINNLTIDNNAIDRAARGVAFNGTAAANSTGVAVINNAIGAAGGPSSPSPPYDSPTTTVYQRGIVVQGANALTINGNTVRNVFSYVGLSTAGIELTSGIGSGIVDISGNSVTSVVVNAEAGAPARGIAVLSAGGPYSLKGNSITDVENFSSSATGQACGLLISSTGASANVDSNMITRVYGLTRFLSRGVQGISLSAGNNHVVVNNFVSDINQEATPSGSYSTVFGTFGIRVNAGTGHVVQHNSVNLFGEPVLDGGADYLSAAFCLAATSQTGCVVRNNLFRNTMTAAINSAYVAVFLPAGGTSAMNLTWNNNAYYSGTDFGQGIAQVGSSPSGTAFYDAGEFDGLRSYTSGLSAAGTNDDASFVSIDAPGFGSETDLHLQAGMTTQLESRGAAAGVATDIDGDLRPGPAGSVNGGAFAPDVGADEFDGVPVFAKDIAAAAFVDPSDGGLKAQNVPFAPQASFQNTGLSRS